ncbi:hypothetical protein [Yinghuangia sp. YIM S10712]|uniref:hypothetical protein n=1 Tax=Yinghuangia sp. YIM S10712 TaxID=3436930 RepID=UPI003F537EA2
MSGAALMAAIRTLVPRDKLASAGALVALTTDLGSLISPALCALLRNARLTDENDELVGSGSSRSVPSPPPARSLPHGQGPHGDETLL